METIREGQFSISETYKMLNNISTSLGYINACKMRISIDKMRWEMGMIRDEEFKSKVNETLQKIINAVLDMKIYTTSEPFNSQSGEKFKEVRCIEISESFPNPHMNKIK